MSSVFQYIKINGDEMNIATQHRKELSESEVIKMAIDSCSIQLDSENNGVIYTDYGTSPEIINLLNLGKAICEFDEPAFEYTKNLSGSHSLTATPIGKKLLNLKKSKTNLHHRYDCVDYIAIPLEELEKAKPKGLCLGDVDLALSNVKLAEAFNEFVEASRKRLQSHKVQQRIENRKKNAYRNYLSAIDYVDGLFTQHARLNVIRLDIGYKRFSDGSMVGLEQVLSDHAALKVAMNKSDIFDNCLGYIHRLELGVGNDKHDLHKGYHYHLFFFFDANVVNGDVFKAKEIGELWQSTITQGQGIYHNCNLNCEVNYGEKNAIGKVHFADSKKRDNLKRAIGYVTKASQYLAVKEKPRMRQFFKGQLPRKTSNAGRRRKAA